MPYRDTPLPGTYRGFAVKGKPDGRGEWTADCGASYSGEWRGGLHHGQGIETAENGNVYRGGFSLGKVHGMGELLNPRGELVAEMMYEHGLLVLEYGPFNNTILKVH